MDTDKTKLKDKAKFKHFSLVPRKYEKGKWVKKVAEKKRMKENLTQYLRKPE